MERRGVLGRAMGMRDEGKKEGRRGGKQKKATEELFKDQQNDRRALSSPILMREAPRSPSSPFLLLLEPHQSTSTGQEQGGGGR
jgi:hypothetical protein